VAATRNGITGRARRLADGYSQSVEKEGILRT
jgi:hypothetical protein